MTEINPVFPDTLEPFLRVIIFLGLILIIALLEITSPKRPLCSHKIKRWSINFSLLFLNTGLLRLIFPLAAVGIAQYAQQQHWGLLNLLSLPATFTLIIGFFILDLCIYWQHRLFHIVPLFWRLHKVHHSDVDFDTTTGFRFHPIEILLSMVVKMIIIIAFGIPVLSVMVFEIALSSTALFNHGNIRIPEKIDKYLRWFIVTPDMHRVHHSVNLQESNRNFSFNIPWWDWLFKSYQAQPLEGHLKMNIGLLDYVNAGSLRLFKLLTMPFARQNQSSKTDI